MDLINNNKTNYFINYFSSESLIIISTILLRLLQGASLSLVCAVFYSYIPVLFPEELEKSYAFLEICTGIGLALGPVIAGFLYEYTGFTLSFLIMSLVYLIFMFLVLPYMIKMNKILEEEALKKAAEKMDEVKPIDALKMLKNKDILLTIMVFWFNLMSYCVIQPDFSDHIHSYHGTDDTVGMIFGLGDLTYALTGFLVMHYINKIHLSRKYLFIFGGILSMIGLLIIGPEKFTFLPRNLIVVSIGMGILGCSQMFYVPIFIPEILDILKEIDGKAKGNEEMASALFIAGIGGISFMGSIMGGFLSDECGFDRGMTIYALFSLGIIGIYTGMRKSTYKLTECQKKGGVLDSELALLEDTKIW